MTAIDKLSAEKVITESATLPIMHFSSSGQDDRFSSYKAEFDSLVVYQLRNTDETVQFSRNW